MFSDFLKKMILEKNMDLARIKRAYDLAFESHDGQTRKSGEPYIIHPMWIAEKLCELGADEDTIITGLLHDTVEDTDVTLDDICESFGVHVANMVEGLTKLSKFKYKGTNSMEERSIDSFFQMIFTSAKDVRVILVKLVDRLHNLLTIGFLPKSKRQRIAHETMDIFVPIASFLGVWFVMVGLEESCFKVLNPKEYKKVDSYFNQCEKKYENILENTKNMLSKFLGSKSVNNKIDFFVRRKHSFFLKSKNLSIPFFRISFPIGFEIVVDDDETCYKVLYIVHSLFNPRFDKMQDYISRPKKNGYKAFHTWIYLNDGEICCEVKILSKEMKKINDLGIFCDQSRNKKETMEFIEEIIKSQNRNTKMDKKSFFEEIKQNILQEKIHISSDDGKFYDLPKESIVLDFAYKKDPKEALYAKSALQNDIEVSLFAPLFPGDTIKIIKGKEPRISSEWLDHVSSREAIAGIKKYLETQESKKNIESGKKILKRKLKWLGLDVKDLSWVSYFKEQGMPQNKIYEGIGAGSLDEIALISNFLRTRKILRHFESEKLDNPKLFYRLSFQIIGTKVKDEFFMDLFSDFNISVAKLSTRHMVAKDNHQFRICGELYFQKIENVFRAFEKISVQNDLFSLTF
jgi:RelA/SpoT family (p)ppGpp synthetase